MFKIVIISVGVFSLFLLFLLLNITTPASAGPFVILAVFISAYILFTCLVMYSLYEGSKLLAHLSKVFMLRRPIKALSIKRSYYFATVGAAAPIMIIGLQSVGAVGIYEFLLVFLFCVLGCLYIIKRV